jgi:hypothetical protein
MKFIKVHLHDSHNIIHVGPRLIYMFELCKITVNMYDIRNKQFHYFIMFLSDEVSLNSVMIN